MSRRFYEPLARGQRAIHSLELRLGVEAGLVAKAIFGSGAERQAWAKRMRTQLKTKADGVARVLKSAVALRH